MPRSLLGFNAAIKAFFVQQSFGVKRKSHPQGAAKQAMLSNNFDKNFSANQRTHQSSFGVTGFGAAGFGVTGFGPAGAICPLLPLTT